MPCIPSSCFRARDRYACDRREALGERRVTAPPHSHLAVDDDASDAGNVTARDRAEGVLRQRGDPSIFDCENLGGPDRNGFRPPLLPQVPAVLTSVEVWC